MKRGQPRTWRMCRANVSLIILFPTPVPGIFRGGAEVLVRCKLALSEGVHMQLTVRSTDPTVAEIITMAIG